MSNRIDFIVDPSGQVQDVRHLNYSAGSSPPSSQKTGTEPSEHPSNTPPYTQKSNTTPYFIVIPIGLIITLTIVVTRFLNLPPGINFHSPSDVSSLNRGIHYFSEGDYDKAIGEFDTVIKSEPNLGEVYNYRGLAYQAKADYDRALTDFTKAIELQPNSATSYNNRGAVYLFKGDDENALADLDKALSLEPNFGKAYYNRGSAYLHLGNYDNSIADFDQAIKFSANDISKMQYQRSIGDDSISRSMVNQLQYMQSDADLPSTFAHRGLAYLSRGDDDKALEDFDKAIELQPDLALAYYYRGVAYYLTGRDNEKAIADFEKVLELNNDPSAQQEAETRLQELGVK